MVICAPTGAAAGANVVGRGGWITTSSSALVAVPSTVVTAIFPVTAPRGTVRRSSIGVDDCSAEAGRVSAPIVTVGGEAPTRRFVPVTVTTVLLPGTAPAGLNPMIRGSTV